MPVRRLIRGGTVLSMDPAVGELAAGDVLVEGTTIAAVGTELDAGPDAEVIDASGTVVLPGFVDTHHHQYQTALRGGHAESTLADYFEVVNGRITPCYRPEDVRIAELVASLGQLDAGVTTGVDISQVSLTPDHADAALDGLAEAGRRTVFSYSTLPSAGRSTPDRARELERLRERTAYADLLTLGAGVELSPEVDAQLAQARELGLRTLTHVQGQHGHGAEIVRLARAGLLGPDNELVHVTGLDGEAWAAIRDSGAPISLSVPIELAMGHGLPPIQLALDHGVRPSLSVDVECTMTADPFSQLRAVFTLQRGLAHERALTGAADAPALLDTRDVLGLATVEGARAAGLADTIGSLTPGKQADIVLLRADTIGTMPANDPAGAVVTLMDRSNVDTVLVAGTPRKRDGALLGVDLPRLRAELTRSRDHLYAAAGLT